MKSQFVFLALFFFLCYDCVLIRTSTNLIFNDRQFVRLTSYKNRNEKLNWSGNITNLCDENKSGKLSINTYPFTNVNTLSFEFQLIKSMDVDWESIGESKAVVSSILTQIDLGVSQEQTNVKTGAVQLQNSITNVAKSFDMFHSKSGSNSINESNEQQVYILNQITDFIPIERDNEENLWSLFFDFEPGKTDTILNVYCIQMFINIEYNTTEHKIPETTASSTTEDPTHETTQETYPPSTQETYPSSTQETEQHSTTQEPSHSSETRETSCESSYETKSTEETRTGHQPQTLTNKVTADETSIQTTTEENEENETINYFMLSEHQILYYLVPLIFIFTTTCITCILLFSLLKNLRDSRKDYENMLDDSTTVVSFPNSDKSGIIMLIEKMKERKWYYMVKDISRGLIDFMNYISDEDVKFLTISYNHFFGIYYGMVHYSVVWSFDSFEFSEFDESDLIDQPEISLKDEKEEDSSIENRKTERTKRTLLGIIEIIKYLKDRKLIHRRIRKNNILYMIEKEYDSESPNEYTEQFKFKLSGISKIVFNCSPTIDSSIEKDKEAILSPETISNSEYSYSTDLFEFVQEFKIYFEMIGIDISNFLKDNKDERLNIEDLIKIVNK